MRGGLSTRVRSTNWNNEHQLKMVAGYSINRRAHKPYKNGFSAKTNGFSAHEEEKLKDFKESFVEEFEDTPFQVAVLTYLSYFFLILFGYLRDFMRKYGLERSKAPREFGNKVSEWKRKVCLAVYPKRWLKICTIGRVFLEVSCLRTWYMMSFERL